MIRKLLWRFLAFYLIAVALSVMSFPRSIYGALKDGHPEVLAKAPSLLPVVARSYAQIALAGVWPFARDGNAVPLSILIDEKGRETFPGNRVISFNLTPQVRPGQEGRHTYSLGKEIYDFGTSAAYAELLPPGLVVRLGQYFCLSDRIKHALDGLSAEVTCFRLIHKSADIFEWQQLGQAHGRIAVLEP